VFRGRKLPSIDYYCKLINVIIRFFGTPFAQLYNEH
jgi:hypothetical protein